MPTTAEIVDAPIREVDQARARVARLTAKQITKADDRDYLKSVAYSWFKSHRPIIASSVREMDLEVVDGRMKEILDATARSSMRTTYLAMLKGAKGALATLRGVSLVARNPTVLGVDAPPDFTPLASEPMMKAILERRWEESHRCLEARAPLAATVMMGGLLEALFVARANLMSDKKPLFRAKAAPWDAKTKRPLALTKWTLGPYIDVGAELGWISRPGRDIATVLRDYRNYVHPEKERSHGVALNDNDSAMFWDLTKNVARQLLSSASDVTI